MAFPHCPLQRDIVYTLKRYCIGTLILARSILVDVHRQRKALNEGFEDDAWMDCTEPRFFTLAEDVARTHLARRAPLAHLYHRVDHAFRDLMYVIYRHDNGF